MKSTEYYSNGKFLLTGEYVILDEALALTVPLKFGQSLEVNPNNLEIINFKTFQSDLLIYENSFILEDNHIKCCNQSDKISSDKFISELLNHIYILKPELFQNGIYFISRINFGINWGLGSSSSLISNFAQWSGIDKFELFKKVSNGSGYDVFAAKSDEPIIYKLDNQIPTIEKVNLNLEIFNQCLFVYLGAKQNSEKEVVKYKRERKISKEVINEISEITKAFCEVKSLQELIDLINLHENIISDVLARPRIKQELFKDFVGEIKSLGAWGGDFVMVISEYGLNYTKEYFKNKNYSVLFEWNEIVK